MLQLLQDDERPNAVLAHAELEQKGEDQLTDSLWGKAETENRRSVEGRMAVHNR